MFLFCRHCLVLVNYVNGACLFQVSTIVDKDKNLEGDEFVVIDMTSPEITKKTCPMKTDCVL